MKRPDSWKGTFEIWIGGKHYKAGTRFDWSEFNYHDLSIELRHRCKLLAEISLRTIKKHKRDETT